MKNTENNIEEVLLSGKSLDELIKMKMQKELEEEIKNSQKKPEFFEERNISNVPAEKIFSKDSIFKIFNRKTKVESFITGIQADGFLGLRDDLREQILKGELSVFESDGNFISFEKIVLER